MFQMPMTAVCSVLRRSLSSPSCMHSISFCATGPGGTTHGNCLLSKCDHDLHSGSRRSVRRHLPADVVQWTAASAAGFLPSFRSYCCPSPTAKPRHRLCLSGIHSVYLGCIVWLAFFAEPVVRAHYSAQHSLSLAVSSAHEKQKLSHLGLHPECPDRPTTTCMKSPAYEKAEVML